MNDDANDFKVGDRDMRYTFTRKNLVAGLYILSEGLNRHVEHRPKDGDRAMIAGAATTLLANALLDLKRIADALEAIALKGDTRSPGDWVR